MGILEVLDGIVVACAANAKDDGDVEATLGAFHFALSSRLKLLDSAVDVLDDVGVKEYRSKSCERVFWKIKSSKDKEYTILERYCSCRSFFELARADQAGVVCKHIVAVRLARALGVANVEYCSDDLFGSKLSL